MGILVVLVLVLLVTLENKVNSNSDQFKFVQLSSKSGWSLTISENLGSGGKLKYRKIVEHKYYKNLGREKIWFRKKVWVPIKFGYKKL